MTWETLSKPPFQAVTVWIIIQVRKKTWFPKGKSRDMIVQRVANIETIIDYTISVVESISRKCMKMLNLHAVYIWSFTLRWGWKKCA